MELRRKRKPMDTKYSSNMTSAGFAVNKVANPSVVVFRSNPRTTRIRSKRSTVTDHEVKTTGKDSVSIEIKSKTNKGAQDGGEGVVSAPPTTHSEDEDIGPPIPSTRIQKLSRKLAREKQLEKVKRIEQSESRRERYLKRQRKIHEEDDETDYVALAGQEQEREDEAEALPGKKQVKWNETIKYHSYTPEPVTSLQL